MLDEIFRYGSLFLISGNWFVEEYINDVLLYIFLWIILGGDYNYIEEMVCGFFVG